MADESSTDQVTSCAEGKYKGERNLTNTKKQRTVTKYQPEQKKGGGGGGGNKKKMNITQPYLSVCMYCPHSGVVGTMSTIENLAKT